MTGRLLVAGLLAGPSLAGGETPVAHVRTEFQFPLEAPFEKVFPLFGALGEKAWAGSEWNPRFLHPETPRDVPGMVFTTEHGGHHATWVNTAFDAGSGHAQYVSIVDGALVTVVDVQVARRSPGVLVTVVYERTALRAELNSHVQGLAEGDRRFAKEWEEALRAVLGLAQPRG
jgi:hypothetical protein